MSDLMSTSHRNAQDFRPLLAWLLTLAVAVFPLLARADILPNRPDAIVCSVKDPTGTLPWEQLVFYVSARTNDDRTLYKTLTSDPVVVFINAQGVVEGTNLADCDGRTPDQLREDGRAFWFTTHRGAPSQ
jgi:hypothetical protein